MEKWSITRRDLGKVIKVVESGYEAVVSGIEHFENTHRIVDFDYVLKTEINDDFASLRFKCIIKRKMNKEEEELLKKLKVEYEINYIADYVIERAIY